MHQAFSFQFVLLACFAFGGDQQQQQKIVDILLLKTFSSAHKLIILKASNRQKKHTNNKKKLKKKTGKAMFCVFNVPMLRILLFDGCTHTHFGYILDCRINECRHFQRLLRAMQNIS